MKGLYARVLLISLFSGLAGCMFSNDEYVDFRSVYRVVFHSEAGVSIQAVYSGEGYVQLTFDDGHVQLLQQVVSASGSRYSAGDAQWWEHHGEATYSLNGQVVFAGKQYVDRQY
jgi:hypothetical protein